MSERLYLFAPGSATDTWRFCLLADDGDAVDGTGLEAAAAARLARPDATVELRLVVPGEDVLRTTVTVPARSRRQLEMAAPYQVEEFLAEDVEQTQLAIGRRQGDGRLPVAAMAPHRLREWLDTLAEAGLEVTCARTDLDALTAAEADFEALVTAERALVKARGGDAVAVDREMLERVLQTMLATVPDTHGPATLDLHVAAGDDGLDLAALDSALGQSHPVEVRRHALAGSTQRWIATALERDPDGLELLQGPFAPPASGGSGWRRWRLVAGLAAFWVLAQLTLDVGRTSWLEQRAADLREESVATFREIHPDRTRVPDPRRELQALLEAGGGATQAAFLELLGAAAARIEELDDNRIELRSLAFNARRGDLALDLGAPGIAVVDRFKADMERNGYPVVIDSAVQEAQGVRARVRVRPGDGGREVTSARRQGRPGEPG